MYMRDFWAALARRWLLVLCCLGATVGLALLVGAKVPPNYQSSADVVLVPPKSSADPTANRFLSLSDLRQAVDVLTRSLGSDSTVERIKASAPAGHFVAAADVTTSAPILIVTATAGRPEQAQQLLESVIAQVPLSLADLQQSVRIATKDQITPQMVAQDERPKAVYKKQIRAVGACVAFTLLMSAMLIGAVDNLLVRRRWRRDELAAIEDLARSSGPQPMIKSAAAADWPTKKKLSATGKSNAVAAKSRR